MGGHECVEVSLGLGPGAVQVLFGALLGVDLGLFVLDVVETKSVVVAGLDAAVLVLALDVHG